MKYRITYTRNGREITTARTAETAEKAVEMLCDQYGWRGRLNQYDADTRGLEWAEVFADPEGGINYSIRIVATQSKEEVTMKTTTYGLKMVGLKAASSATHGLSHYGSITTEIIYNTETGEIRTKDMVGNSWTVLNPDGPEIMIAHARERMTMQQIADAIYQAMQAKTNEE